MSNILKIWNQCEKYNINHVLVPQMLHASPRTSRTKLPPSKMTHPKQHVSTAKISVTIDCGELFGRFVAFWKASNTANAISTQFQTGGRFWLCRRKVYVKKYVLVELWPNIPYRKLRKPSADLNFVMKPFFKRHRAQPSHKTRKTFTIVANEELWFFVE